MMAALIRQVCALSLLCGVVTALTPAGSTRKAVRFVCSAALLACVLGGVGGMDWEEYALRLSQTREREQAFPQQSEGTRSALERRVIESECAAYILDKAREMGCGLDSVSVTAQWSTEGVWVPYSVRLRSGAEEAERHGLSDRITAELGIPPERQEWIRDG